MIFSGFPTRTRVVNALVCSECGSKLTTNKRGWLEHHEDGSHTFHPEQQIGSRDA